MTSSSTAEAQIQKLRAVPHARAVEPVSGTFRLPGLGWTCDCSYPRMFVPALLLGGRLSFGFYLLWSGLDKLITDFSSAGFLVNVSRGPLQDVFVNLGESSAMVNVIDPLVVWGQIFIGATLLIGLFTRFALTMAGLQMFLFYLPQLWPEHNPILSEHIFYIGSFGILAALGAGRIFGVDMWLERTEAVRRPPRLAWVLG